jgi:hypothetical protein
MAQESTTDNPVAPRAPLENAVNPKEESSLSDIREAPLQTLLQPNKSGELVPVPVFAPTTDGELKQHVMTWEDIDQLLDQSADEQGPRVTYREVSITGAAQDDRADLTIELTILASAHRWVRAPIGLSNVVLSGYEATSKGFLEFDEKDGFVFWIEPTDRSSLPQDKPNPAPTDPDGEMTMPAIRSLQLVERRLTLRVSAPVVSNGAEHRLALRVPRASQAHMDLLVDVPDAVANVIGGDALVTTQDDTKANTRIKIEGVGGEWITTWRPQRAATAPPAPILDSQGIFEVAIDENDRIECSARLTIRSLSEPFESFRVKLPPGMRLAPHPTTEYELEPIETPEPPGENGVRIVEVRLRQATVGPITVRLDAVSLGQSPQTSFIEVAGFQVTDAVEQWGHVLLISSGDRSISWVESPEIAQVNEAPPPLRRSDDVVARFKFFAQPFSLQIKVSPKKTRIRVEPVYLVEVFSDQVKLTATFKYQIQGAKASFVHVDMQGWEVESVGGDDVVNGGGLKFDQLAPLEIPFRTAVAGDVTVRVTARRIVQGPSGSLRIPLPNPSGDFLASAILAVAPSENIELIPQLEQSHGLISEPPTSVVGLPLERPAVYFFRSRAGDAGPVLSATYEVKARHITIDATADVVLNEARVDVRQSFTYTIAFEPLDELILLAPRKIFENDRLHFQYEGETIIPSEEESNGDAPVRLKFRLPLAVGRRTLTANFSLQLPETRSRQTVGYNVPLIAPWQSDSSPNSPRDHRVAARISTRGPLRVSMDQNKWKTLASADSQPADVESFELVGDSAITELPLRVTRTSAETHQIVVDKAWLQSWLTPLHRRDRMALRLTTDEDWLHVQLPVGADINSVLAFVNGQEVARGEVLSIEPATPSSGSGVGSARVSLNLAALNKREYTIEVWYGFTVHRSQSFEMKLESPRIENASWLRQMYWQLVLPSDEHLIDSNTDMNFETQWNWTGWFWARKPNLQQNDLEQWIGASIQPAPIDARVYLFSAFGQTNSLRVVSVRRHTAVFALSGTVLIFGLVWVRAAGRGRQRLLVVGVFAAMILLGLAMAVATDLALLAAQGASLGAVGVAFAWIVSKIVAGKDASHSNARLPRPSSQVRIVTVEPSNGNGNQSSYATTATAPSPSLTRESAS